MDLRCPPPRLVLPVPVDPDGRRGPTRGAARGPGWRRTGRGLYVPAATPLTVEQRILEEWCRVPRAVVSGWAACRLYGAAYADGIDARTGRPVPVPLVLPPDDHSRPSAGVRLVRQPLAPTEVTRRHGIRVVTPGRAVVEAARLAADPVEAVVAVEMAYAGGVALPEWAQAAADCAPPRGLRQVRQALATAGVRSCSPPETRLRLVCLELGWRPLANVDVLDAGGRFLARPDLLDVERGIAIEYDGADHRSRARHIRDNERLRLLRGVGIEVVTVVGGGVLRTADREQARAMLVAAESMGPPRLGSGRWTYAERWTPAADLLRAAQTA